MLSAGLGNLSTKNRPGDRPSSSKSRHVTRQSPLSDKSQTGKQKSVLRRETGHETGFKAGQGLASATCPVLKTARVPVYSY